MDYKKAYLQERVKALQIEASLLQTRFEAVQKELPQAIKELEDASKDEKTDPASA